LRAPFQAQEISRHPPGIFEQLIGLRKIKIVDDVNQKQRDLCLSGALPCKSMFFSGICEAPT
jgi:hypothetical protein